MALIAYQDKEGDYPIGPFAREWAEKSHLPTCDTNDTWRLNCESPQIGPMMGSFAYVRMVPGLITREDWDAYAKSERTVNRGLVASIAYASIVSPPFEGQGALSSNLSALERQKCIYPDKVVLFQEDGNV